MFIFIVYNVIHSCKVALDYSLFVKLGIWEKIEELIYEITHTLFIIIATKIKEINLYIDVPIWH